jgi:hypothetical protein
MFGPEEKKPSGLIVSVFRDADGHDCTRGGISSKYTELTLILPEGGPFEPTEDRPAVILERRKLSHLAEPYLTAYPADRDSGQCWMSGGNFISCCDSRFPSLYPIPIHDRTE